MITYTSASNECINGALFSRATRLRASLSILFLLFSNSLFAGFELITTVNVPAFQLPALKGRQFPTNYARGEIGGAVLTAYLSTCYGGDIEFYTSIERYAEYQLSIKGVSAKYNRIHGLDGILIPLEKSDEEHRNFCAAPTPQNPVIVAEAKYKTLEVAWTGPAPLNHGQMSYDWIKTNRERIQENCLTSQEDDLKNVTTQDDKKRKREKKVIKNTYKLVDEVLACIPDESLSIVGVFCPDTHLTLFARTEAKAIARKIFSRCYKPSLVDTEESKRINRFYRVTRDSIQRSIESASHFKKKHRKTITTHLTVSLDYLKEQIS